jgi:hypothetical protein
MTANAALECILDVSVKFRDSMDVICLMTIWHENAVFDDEMVVLQHPSPILTDGYAVHGDDWLESLNICTPATSSYCPAIARLP